MQTTRQQHSVQLSVILATICVVILLVGGAADAEEPPGPAIEHVVAHGETLWDIAANHLGPSEDVRIMVRAIKDRSGLTSSSLQIGQVLYIPSD